LDLRRGEAIPPIVGPTAWRFQGLHNERYGGRKRLAVRPVGFRRPGRTAGKVEAGRVERGKDRGPEPPSRGAGPPVVLRGLLRFGRLQPGCNLGGRPLQPLIPAGNSRLATHLHLVIRWAL
jgi:hypothetical protein